MIKLRRFAPRFIWLASLAPREQIKFLIKILMLTLMADCNSAAYRQDVKNWDFVLSRAYRPISIEIRRIGRAREVRSYSFQVLYTFAL